MVNIKTKELLTNYPHLGQLKNDLSNLNEVGQYMLKKFVEGKHKNNLFYCEHALTYTNSSHIPIAAMSNAPFSKKRSIWKQVKEEVYKILCTKDRRYTKERNRLFTSTKALTNSAIISIAASIGKVIGIGTGIIAGAVAALIFAAAKAGINVYCKIASQDS